MSDITLRYPPIPLTRGCDDREAFALGFPDMHNWLCHNAIPFRLSVYRWPEMMARLLGNGLGTTIYEIEIILADNYAKVVNDDA